MSQRFLLSAAARTLSLRSVYAMGEEKAYETFCKLRWSETEGDPVCPRCGCLNAYRIPTRRKFKCVGCYHQFSVTSGTIFASRKMAFTDLLAAIVIFANAVKGISALQLSRDLDCQHKTAFVLAHKIREAMAAETKGLKLTGECEIDGAYFGGSIPGWCICGTQARCGASLDRGASSPSRSWWGGTVLSALAHPWFYVLAALELAGGGMLARPESLFGWPFWLIAWFDLSVGYLASMGLGFLTVRRRGYRALLKQVPLMPLYWLLISVAAYRALWQFLTARFEWEKTEHGLGTSLRPTK